MSENIVAIWSINEFNYSFRYIDNIQWKSEYVGDKLSLLTSRRYFHKDKLFGLACFENMSVDNKSERGARMKSVGVLARSYGPLYQHLAFLQGQVRYVVRWPVLGLMHYPSLYQGQFSTVVLILLGSVQ